MSVEQRNIVKETSLKVITPEMASEALGALPPTGFAKKMEINEAREVFSNFVKKHDARLMSLLKKAEKFAVEEVAPSVERVLANAALGQGGNGNDHEVNPTPKVQRKGLPISGTRIEGCDMEDNDNDGSSYKRVKMDL